MAGCRAPALQVYIPGGWWCILVVGGASLVAGGASWWLVVHPRWLVVPPWWLVVWSSMAGGASLVAGGASWHPRPHIAAGHSGRGTHPLLSAAGTRRRNPSFKGIKMKGYSSIYQLFKFSYRMPYAKVFTGKNLIKTLFSINYRGYFIIQAAHSTLNYSYFLHKTDRKHVENQ